MKREDKINVKDNEITLYFSEKFLLDGIYEIQLPHGDSINAYGIVVPDENYDENGSKRVVLVYEKRVHINEKPRFKTFENERYAYLMRTLKYPILDIDGFTQDGKCILKSSQEKMTGEEIVESFKRYRAALAKNVEHTFMPKKEED